MQVQSKTCIDLCRSEEAAYSIGIPLENPNEDGESDIAGLLTARIVSLPLLTWQGIVSVRGLLKKVISRAKKPSCLSCVNDSMVLE